MKLFFLILFSVPTVLNAQNKKVFRIIGYSDFYNNHNVIIQGGVFTDTYKYNDFNFKNDKADTSNNPYKLAQVQNKYFTINGLLKYPHPFSVSYYDAEKNIGNNSNFFFIDAGTINIEIDDLSANKSLGNRLYSKSNKEYQFLKKLYSNSVDTLTGEIYDLATKQKTIEKYIFQNPNSYVALWDMVIDYAINMNYKNDNDKKILLKIARLLSLEIKKTSTYQALVKNINQDLKLTTGKIFPNILLNSIYQDADITGGKVFPNIPLNAIDSLIPVIKKNKFTLLDFWFSYCKPCIEQFPLYKKIYDQNKSKQFEIIGISVDRKEDEANWQKVIKKFNLDWLQYLDTREIITRELHITSFPSNFLLDHDGKIIKKNISPQELEIFLQEKLH